MPNIVIHGNKVILRSADIQDLKACYYWEYKDEKQEAQKWNRPFSSPDGTTQAEFIDEWKNFELFPGVPGLLVIEADNQLIGIVDADWVDKNTNWLEIGIIIYKPEYWGNGYGTEAFKLFINYLFTNTPLHRLGITTWSGNVRMTKTAAKLGMKEEGRIRQARSLNGEYYDVVKMGILKCEWEAATCPTS